jgi:uncharacterized protein YggU (UPF0235/DUF167 family)
VRHMDITVKVKPGSSKGPLVLVLEITGGNPLYTVFLRERPTDGQANAALRRTLARYFDVGTSAVHIRHGSKSSLKRVWVDTVACRRSEPH